MIAIDRENMKISFPLGMSDHDKYIECTNAWRNMDGLTAYPFPVYAERDPQTNEVVMLEKPNTGWTLN